jgi:hypothetical protein
MGALSHLHLALALVQAFLALAVVIHEGEAKDREDAVRSLSFYNMLFALSILYCGLSKNPSITLYECVSAPVQAARSDCSSVAQRPVLFVYARSHLSSDGPRRCSTREERKSISPSIYPTCCRHADGHRRRRGLLAPAEGGELWVRRRLQ